MIQENCKIIFEELHFVLSSIDENQVKNLIDQILKAKTIVVCGAGRVGLMTRCFGMRLGHLGLNAFTLGDSTVPSIGAGDLLLVSSGSGETQTIYDLAMLGEKNGAHLALISGNPESRIGKIADTLVVLQAPSKTKSVNGFSSIQPMTTLNEQCLLLFFDALVLELMQKMHQTHDTMWARHSNLE